MSVLLAPTALLPDGWASDVRLEIDVDGILTSVIPGAEAAGGGETVDGVVLPGVPNLHSHAFQRALAGLAERGAPGGDGFWRWRQRMYDFLERLTPDGLEAVAAQLYVEMLEAGFTAVAEFHYLHLDPSGAPYADPAELSRRVVAASRSAGIGLTHLPVLYTASDFGGAPPTAGQRRFILDVDALLEVVAVLRDDLEGDADRRVGLALHSLRAVPPGPLADALAGFRALDAGGPVHIHVAEQEREVEACLEWSGARPVAWLLDHAPVDRRWCLVHATHMDPGETRRVAASGAVAGLCPTTEANLGDGLFPLPPYLAAGGVFGVGSDSHVSVSPVEELRWLEYGQRLALRRRNVAAGPEDRSTGRILFDAAVRGGEQALARGAGALAPGRRADLMVLDGDHPLLAGRAGDALLDTWIFSGDANVVRHVMVGGRWVVRQGRHLRRDEAAARYREAL
ncbi:MAG TPA: formimidoylglutamate deiminase, partial [Longimicrobiales bacterium]|nr:formimidoylglutamate deiminase [Longimicrobiales bacterium]